MFLLQKLAAVSYPLDIYVFATAAHNFKQIEINLILQHEFDIHADLLTYNQWKYDEISK